MTVPPARSRRPYDLVTAAHDYPPWQGPPRRTILICSHPRSGSTLLGEALYFAGGMGCPLEYFHAGFQPALEARWRTTDIGAYIAAVHRHRTDPGGTLAVKLFWRDVPALAARLAPTAAPPVTGRADETPAAAYQAILGALTPVLPDPCFVHLARRDRVRQAISGASAIATGTWRSIPGIGEEGGVAGYDDAQIGRLIGDADACHAHWEGFFAAIGVRPLALTYEALAADYAATVTQLFRQLGSDAAPPPVRLRRQADAHSEAMLLRYLRSRGATTPAQ